MATDMGSIKICVAGLWHLGSVTAACLAQKGFQVSAWDPNPAVVAGLNLSKAPLFEPGLEDLLSQGLTSKRLSFTTSTAEALKNSDFLWITFDTPVNSHDQANISWVKTQTYYIFEHLRPGMGVIISSQLPVGTCGEFELILKKRFKTQRIPICSSPENLRLGKAIEIFQKPDRIIAGIRAPSDMALFSPVFKSITDRVEWMKTESAEMTKHAINSFLALSITFANELAVLCESVGADAREVERGLKTEFRIGPKAYLKPGAAFAGGTLARDVQFLTLLGKRFHRPSTLLSAILISNRRHLNWVRNTLQERLERLRGRTVAILGLTYKEGTDTLRRSWAVELSKWLRQKGSRVQAFDWQVTQLPKPLKNIISLKQQITHALDDCDAVVIATDHRGIQQITSADFKRLSHPVIIDPNGSLNRALIESLSSVEYCSVGFTIKRKNGV
jgi:UDPglucose 6-dehydrogenase